MFNIFGLLSNNIFSFPLQSFSFHYLHVQAWETMVCWRYKSMKNCLLYTIQRVGGVTKLEDGLGQILPLIQTMLQSVAVACNLGKH